MGLVYFLWFFFFFKQKTAYEMRISDWSSDVCSSDLRPALADDGKAVARLQHAGRADPEIAAPRIGFGPVRDLNRHHRVAQKRHVQRAAGLVADARPLIGSEHALRRLNAALERLTALQRPALRRPAVALHRQSTRP